MACPMTSDLHQMPVLGDLEVAVLESLWIDSEATAKQLHEALASERGISLNTVQSTLERLHRKGLVSRRKRSHAYRYRAAVGREALVAGYLKDMLQRFGGDPAVSLAAFVESAEDVDETTLDRLEAALHRRRERGENK